MSTFQHRRIARAGRHWRSRPGGLPAAAVAVATSLLAALGACGSADSGSSVPASSGGGTDSAVIAKAREAVQLAERRPTELSLQAPINRPVPTGKRVVWMGSGQSVSVLQAKIVEETAKALGWTSSTIPVDGTPQSMKAAFGQILRDKPDVVLYAATPKSAFLPELKQAADAGIFVAAVSTTDRPGDGLQFVIATDQDNGVRAQTFVDWTISKLDGSGTVLYVGLPSYAILQSAFAEFSGRLAKECPACRIQTVDVPLTAIGVGSTDMIVSALRAHPEIKNVIVASDPLAVGLPAALKAAGITGVNLVGASPDPTTLQQIVSGQQSGSIMTPYYEAIYGMMDAAVRSETGLPFNAEGGLPRWWLLDKDNIPTTKDLFPVVEDVKSQYYRLWGVPGA